MSVTSRNCKMGYYTLIICIGLLAHFRSHAQSVNQTESPLQPEPVVSLDTVDWIHGSSNCENLKNEPDYQEWQPIQYQNNTYIFRQNKCSHYEGPFVYLFVGLERGLLIDTGATIEGGGKLLELVRNLTNLPILVVHSHGHSDHRLGDDAFRNAEGISVVDVGQSAVQEYFGFSNWPYESVAIELGGREIQMLPVPGHSDDDLAYYDALTETMVTGDTLYPGRLYVRNWSEYRESIGRLAQWLRDKSISNVLGTHIEMSSVPDIDYPVGTTFQPDEHQLPLGVEDIYLLGEALEKIETPERIPLGSYIIWPI